MDKDTFMVLERLHELDNKLNNKLDIVINKANSLNRAIEETNKKVDNIRD